MIVLLLLLACAHHAKPPPTTTHAPPPASETVAPAGQVKNGVYTDHTWAFTLPIVPGWAATPGLADSPLRLTVTHADTGARVLVSARSPDSLTPIPRPDCEWTFLDEGHYRILRVPGEVSVATCTPNDPTQVHVFLVILSRSDAAWHIEIEAPGTAMTAAKRAGEALLAGARWTAATTP